MQYGKVAVLKMLQYIKKWVSSSGGDQTSSRTEWGSIQRETVDSPTARGNQSTPKSDAKGSYTSGYFFSIYCHNFVLTWHKFTRLWLILDQDKDWREARSTIRSTYWGWSQCCKDFILSKNSWIIIWIIAVFKTNHIQLRWARFTCHDFIFFQFDEHSDAAAETKLKKGIIKLFISQM